MAAPISRFRLTRRSRHSKMTMASAEQRAHSRIQLGRQTERMNQVTGNSNKKNK